jgi:hypothetical protein
MYIFLIPVNNLKQLYFSVFTVEKESRNYTVPSNMAAAHTSPHPLQFTLPTIIIEFRQTTNL